MWSKVLTNCKTFISLAKGGGNSEKPHKTTNKEPGQDTRRPCHLIQIETSHTIDIFRI